MLVFFALAGGYASQSLAYDLPTEQSTGIIFTAGDTLRINVLEEKDLSHDYTIDSTGMILFPMLGRVHMAGKTVQEAQDTLTYLLKDGYILDPVISVNVFQSKDFYILGAVKNPGRYALPQSTATVLNAVALAGGFTPDANTKKFEVVRNPDDQERYSEDTSAYTRILSGDIIIVKERFF